MDCKHGNYYLRWEGGDDGHNICTVCELSRLRSALAEKEKESKKWERLYWVAMVSKWGLESLLKMLPEQADKIKQALAEGEK